MGEEIQECEHCNSYGEYALDKCPYTYFKHLEAQKFVRIYDRYSKGFLPYSGGELEQPWRLVYNFNLFESYKQAWEKIWQEE